jgi:hypothetical protein
LGDEAMFDACRAAFPRFRWAAYDDLKYEAQPGRFLKYSALDAKQWLRVIAEEIRTGKRIRSMISQVHRPLQSSAEVGLFGGGTLINDRGMLTEYLTIRTLVNKSIPIFGSGVADPEFWRGRDGFKDESDGWSKALSPLPVVGVRGPRSQQLLQQAGLTNVVISGDPAVMFHSPLAGQRSVKKKIGINCGSSKNAIGNFSDYQDVMAELAKSYIQKGYDVELFAVWPNDLSCCHDVARLIENPRVSVAPVQTSAANFIHWITRFDAVVVLKLHAAILAAAASVPFVMIEYQPKCRDFTSSIDWIRYSVRLDQVRQSGIGELFDDLLEHRYLRERELCQKMCELKDSFQSYCQQIEKLMV